MTNVARCGNNRAMHRIQRELLELVRDDSVKKGMSLRAIAALVGEKNPQKIRHHLYQLQKRGLIKFDSMDNYWSIRDNASINADFYSIPILGAANCGAPSLIAEENIVGYLTISKNILSRQKGIFALRAKGISMNKADINGKTIEDGDYVLIDSNYRNPKSDSYVLSIINGMANIKKYVEDCENDQILLISESTREFPPIVIHKNDSADCFINGRIIYVVKKPGNA